MTTAELLKLYGITYTDFDDANKKLNQHFKVDSVEKIEVYCIKNGKHIKYNISSKNYHKAFLNEVWQELTVAQKIRVLNWHKTAFLKKAGYCSNIPKFEYFADNPYNISYSALARKNEPMLINLDFVLKSKGLDALTIITHECIHYLDFEKFNLLYKKYCLRYLKFHYLPDNENLYKEILSLPVEGKIKNVLTGEYEYISEEVRNDILLLKNYIVCFWRDKETPSKQKYVGNQDSFEHYIEDMFYYTSPLEKRAFLGSFKYAEDIVEKLKAKKHILNELDTAVLENNEKTKFKIFGKIKEIQKDYKMSHYNAINLEFIHKYNQKIASKPVCERLIKKREKIVESLWESKFAYNYAYTPWVKGEKKYE